jgi:hypothetical protein
VPRHGADGPNAQAVVALTIELAGTGQIKPVLGMRGYHLVVQRALQMAWFMAAPTSALRISRVTAGMVGRDVRLATLQIVFFTALRSVLDVKLARDK